MTGIVADSRGGAIWVFSSNHNMHFLRQCVQRYYCHIFVSLNLFRLTVSNPKFQNVQNIF